MTADTSTISLETFSKREHIAAMALQGLCSNIDSLVISKEDADLLPKLSVMLADKLLEELSK